MRRTAHWFTQILGIALGFGFTMLILVALSAGNGSIWLPVATGGVYGLWFGLLPRLEASGARWPLAAFQANAMTVLLMLSTDGIDVGPARKYKGIVTTAWLIVTAILLSTALIRLFKPKKEARPSIGWLLTTVFLALVIGYASSSRGGANPMIDWFARTFHVNVADAEIAVTAFRKTIHFLFYGFVAFAAHRAAIRSGAVKNAVPFAFGITLTLAIFDELRQGAQTGRTGSVGDIVVDLLGAVFIILLVTRIGKKKP